MSADDEPSLENWIMSLIADGRADSLHEAEEIILNTSLPEVSRLCGSDLTIEQLAAHPLFQLFASHGSRGWEDSPL
ncbi:MAG: hypothetical protein R3C99_08185 [Pirellulaceae bacterium]|nr:hypothetical protein [Planctomycetales bacterium]MCA9219418.1 hypothetical protein [Planctomycetales bacterium]